MLSFLDVLVCRTPSCCVTLIYRKPTFTGLYICWEMVLIGLVGRVFTNGLGDLYPIPGCVIPKTLNMILDTSLLNTQQYKVRIKGKVE